MPYLTNNLIKLHTDEASGLIEMHVAEFGLFDHLGIEPTLNFHHVQQHLVVCAPGKEDLARVELVECASNRPDIQ